MICRYESEFSRLLKDENDRFAFTVKGSEFLRKDGIMEKLYRDSLLYKSYCVDNKPH